MACLTSLRGDRPQTASPPALWQGEKGLAFHSALTAYQETIIQRPETQSVSSPDLAEVELLLCRVIHCPRCGSHKALSGFLKRRQATDRLASSSLARRERTRNTLVSYCLPETIIQIPEMQIVSCPDLPTLEPLL